jgi:hypothetical protein
VPLTRSATDGFAPAASQTCVQHHHDDIITRLLIRVANRIIRRASNTIIMV